MSSVKPSDRILYCPYVQHQCLFFFLSHHWRCNHLFPFITMRLHVIAWRTHVEQPQTSPRLRCIYDNPKWEHRTIDCHQDHAVSRWSLGLITTIAIITVTAIIQIFCRKYSRIFLFFLRTYNATFIHICGLFNKLAYDKQYLRLGYATSMCHSLCSKFTVMHTPVYLISMLLVEYF